MNRNQQRILWRYGTAFGEALAILLAGVAVVHREPAFVGACLALALALFLLKDGPAR